MANRVLELSGLLFGLVLLASSPGRAAAASEPGGTSPNACGCYEDSEGVCMCQRKSSCGCPGACEPVGCEEKRQKDLARRMEEELRQIQKDPDPPSGNARKPGGGDREQQREDEKDGAKGGHLSRSRHLSKPGRQTSDSRSST
jgi:hypothetical protein